MEETKRYMLMKRIGLFGHVPFANLVILSGSCAMDKDDDQSDFDVIVVAMKGRVWTVRFFSLLFADIIRVRNKGNGHDKDKLCMSLFLGEDNLSMGIPSNDYEKDLFPVLRPLIGNPSLSKNFCLENGLFPVSPEKDIRKSFMRRAFEAALKGSFGDRFESFVRDIQEKKIRHFIASLGSDTRSRIIVSGNRAETHFYID